MVVMQVGLSMVLLTGAGLFARSLVKLQNEDVGFDRNNVLLLGIDPRLAGYKPTELAALYQQFIERLSSLPQVRNVSMATYAPMSGTRQEQQHQGPGIHAAARRRSGCSGYFDGTEVRGNAWHAAVAWTRDRGTRYRCLTANRGR